MSGAYTGKEINNLNRRSKGGLNSDRPIMLSEIVQIISELASGGTGFLKADGSVNMTGLLNLSGDPVNPLNPVTKQYLEAIITALINGAPGTLNTLGELASAINNDPNFASNLSTQLSGITTDITNIKNYEFKILYYASINTGTGTITKPTNTDIILNDFPQGYDAVVETIVNGEPTGEIAKTAGGVPITVTSFDISGNYTISGTPSAFPIALLYVLKVKSQYMSNLTFDNIIESQNLSAAAASNITFTPNGDISSTDVQSAIQEVRNDTDTNLLLKLDAILKASVSDINLGTDNVNYLTSLGLEGSKYLTMKMGKISAVASGTDTYTATLSPAISSYGGIVVYITFTNPNTVTNPTLALNGLTSDGFVQADGTPIGIGTLKGIVQIKHNGTAWQIIGSASVQNNGITYPLSYNGIQLAIVNTLRNMYNY